MIDINELMRGIPTDCDVVTFDISEQFIYIFDDKTGEIVFMIGFIDWRIEKDAKSAWLQILAYGRVL